MDIFEHEDQITPRRPHTLTVLAMFAAVALLFSWLGAYGATHALLAAEIIAPWPADHDPRLLWMIEAFLCLLGSAIVIAAIFRLLSARQLRRIDAIADAD